MREKSATRPYVTNIKESETAAYVTVGAIYKLIGKERKTRNDGERSTNKER